MISLSYTVAAQIITEDISWYTGSTLPSKNRNRSAENVQIGFLESVVDKQGIKSQFFFRGKQAFKGVYYDEYGRQILEWSKEKYEPEWNIPPVKFTRYEVDAVKITVSLYGQIRDNLEVICTTDQFGNNGKYEVTKTTGNQVLSYYGTVKFNGPQRKFSLEELPLIDIAYFTESSDTLTYNYLETKIADFSSLKINGKQIFTNKRKDTELRDNFFEQRSNSGGSGYELDIEVYEEGGKTIVRSKKLFFSKNITMFDEFQPVGMLVYEDTFNVQHRILNSTPHFKKE